MKNDEEKIQADFVKKIEKFQLKGYILKRTAIPNSTFTTYSQASKNTRTGLQPGLLDYFLILADGTQVWIEFKTKTGRLSKEQKEWIQALTIMTTHVYVCRSADQAYKLVDKLVTDMLERLAHRYFFDKYAKKKQS